MVLIGGIGSYVYQAMALSQDQAKIVDLCDDLLQLFPKERILIDITAQEYNAYPVLQQLDPVLLQVADAYGCMVVTSSGFFYPLAEHKLAYQTALAIKDNKKTYDSDARTVPGQGHILSEDEVLAILRNNGHKEEDVQTWMDNTGKVADMSQLSIALGQSLFPNYQNPDRIVKLYDTYVTQLVRE